MIDPRQTIINMLCDQIVLSYRQSYGNQSPEIPDIAMWAARSALEVIARSNALYHNMEHTVLVSQVGLEIVRSRHIRTGGVTPRDWLQYTIGLVCHDIGYVAGVCIHDGAGSYDRGDGTMVKLPEGHTDAALAPYHVNRGKLFIQQRFSNTPHLDVDMICANIERTRFPIPDDDDHRGTTDYPGLVRAADLLGQMADPNYLQRLPALFYEFEELGTNESLGYTSPAALRASYPRFFWKTVYPYVKDAIEYLSLTQQGRQWIAHLHANVFTAEHGLQYW